MKNIKFYTLDAIRGIAAIFVVSRHSNEFFGESLFFNNSFLAVDIFFLLSGFVIAHAYDGKISCGALSPKNFMALRFIRLYPLYLLSILFCLMVATIRSEDATETIYLNPSVIGNYVLGVFYIPSFLQKLTPSTELFIANAVFWTLFYELLANLVYAYFRKYLTNFNMIILIGLLGCLLIWGGLRSGSMDRGFYWGLDHVFFGVARAFFGIFLGLYLYRLYGTYSLPDPLKKLTALPLLIIVIFLSAPNLYDKNIFAELLCITLLFPICIFWSANTIQNVSYSKPLILLGAISYPIYVFHLPMRELLNFFYKDEIRAYQPLTGIVFMICLFAFCVYMEKYLERPIIKTMKHRWLNIVNKANT